MQTPAKSHAKRDTNADAAVLDPQTPSPDDESEPLLRSSNNFPSSSSPLPTPSVSPPSSQPPTSSNGIQQHHTPSTPRASAPACHGAPAEMDVEAVSPRDEDASMRVAHKRLLDRTRTDVWPSLPSPPSAATPLPTTSTSSPPETPRGSTAAPAKTPREADVDERVKKVKSSHSTQSTLSFAPSAARASNPFASTQSANATHTPHPQPSTPPTPSSTLPSVNTSAPTAPPSPQSAPDAEPLHIAATRENSRLLVLVETLTAQVALLQQQILSLQQMPPPPAPVVSPPALTATASSAVPPHPQPVIPSVPSPTTAPASIAAAAPPKANAPKRAPILRHRAVEPTAALLHAASLPNVSSTDLILSIEYAPHSTGFMRRRVFFPNHVTSPRDTCIAVGSALQDPLSLQIAPPRIPAFLMKANGLATGSLGPLMESLLPSSKEYLYLDAWKQAVECGDIFDLESHAFPNHECVQGWATLLSSTTQAYKPLIDGQPDVEGRHVTIRLGFPHPLLMEAARKTLDNHAQRALESDVAMPSPPLSPTSSTSSTVSNSSHSSGTSPPPPASPVAPLSRCARMCSISVSPCPLRYTCTTVSNWPREHPTELCGGDDKLAAFLRLHAPDLHIVLRDLFGSTDPSTTIICEHQHLHQLLKLQGRTSPEHGISTPLNLHCDVQVMGLQTCTFCWSPGHGTSRCPHRVSARNPVAPTSHQAACRYCYSFSHHAAACRETGPITCKLCEKEGHATHACSFFKPRKQPLSVYLKARTAPSSSQSQSQAPPILNAAQRASAKPWQGLSEGAAIQHSASSSSAHSASTQQFVTVDQLQQALAPISSALYELMTRFTQHSLPAPTSTAARFNPVFSSLPLNGQ